jgi:EAL domain-containing protein (putative c-di-GMP-specific phosphodiesterase class I)
VGDIAESLAKSRIEPRTIEIELTETVLMEASQKHFDALGRLREMGLHIAIDDFGTGYSSLKYLTVFPVNRLKIAQDLVFHVTDELRNATVVKAAIRLARELDIAVIAEGVETEAQAQFLLNAGCENAQGYYYSRPVNAASAAALLRHGRIATRKKKHLGLKYVTAA